MSLELFTLPAGEPPLEWKIRVARMALAEAERIVNEADHSAEGIQFCHWGAMDVARFKLAALEAEQLRRLQSSTVAAGFHCDQQQPAPADSTAPAAAVSISTSERGASGSPMTGGLFGSPPLESSEVDSLSGRCIPASSQLRCGQEPAPANADGGVISDSARSGV